MNDLMGIALDSGIWEVDEEQSAPFKARAFTEAMRRIESAPLELANLLGYEHYAHYRRKCTPQDIHTLRLLAGPHGLIILKMLQAKRNG